MLLCIKHGTLWMILCCDVMSVIGQSQCRSSHLQTTNVTAALDSDALLPCDFNENLLQEARSGDVAVVWTHGTMINLVEIKLSGQPSYWDHRGGRVRTFPKMPGNFSLLISRVQESDLGRYRCELFDGSNCSIAYEVVELRQLKLISENTLVHPLVDNWYFVAAGGAVIILLLISFACCVWYKCVKAPQSSSGNPASDTWSNNSCYANTSYQRDRPPRETACNQWSKSANYKEQEKGQGFNTTEGSIYGNDYEDPCPVYANYVERQF